MINPPPVREIQTWPESGPTVMFELAIAENLNLKRFDFYASDYVAFLQSQGVPEDKIVNTHLVFTQTNKRGLLGSFNPIGACPPTERHVVRIHPDQIDRGAYFLAAQVSPDHRQPPHSGFEIAINRVLMHESGHFVNYIKGRQSRSPSPNQTHEAGWILDLTGQARLSKISGAILNWCRNLAIPDERFARSFEKIHQDKHFIRTELGQK